MMDSKPELRIRIRALRGSIAENEHQLGVGFDHSSWTMSLRIPTIYSWIGSAPKGANVICGDMRKTRNRSYVIFFSK